MGKVLPLPISATLQGLCSTIAWVYNRGHESVPCVPMLAPVLVAAAAATPSVAPAKASAATQVVASTKLAVVRVKAAGATAHHSAGTRAALAHSASTQCSHAAPGATRVAPLEQDLQHRWLQHRYSRGNYIPQHTITCLAISLQ